VPDPSVHLLIKTFASRCHTRNLKDVVLFFHGAVKDELCLQNNLEAQLHACCEPGYLLSQKPEVVQQVAELVFKQRKISLAMTLKPDYISTFLLFRPL
jgi:hypothetical protein